MKPGLRHILPWLVLAAACCVPAQRAGVERPVPEPAPVRVQLLFAGDVMQHLPQVTAARRGDGFDYRGVFAYLRRRFHAADLVVVNLETTLTRTDRYTGYPCFRSPRRGAPDCVAVCIHWGNEYERRENAVQRHLAQFLRRHGADLVVGSHPHVVQPFDADSSHVVLYSLGNFVSNQRRRYCDGGLVAEIEAVRHPDGRMSYSLEAVPVWVAMPGYRVVPSEVGDTMALPEAYALFREDVAEVLGGAYK